MNFVLTASGFVAFICRTFTIVKLSFTYNPLYHTCIIYNNILLSWTIILELSVTRNIYFLMFVY